MIDSTIYGVAVSGDLFGISWWNHATAIPAGHAAGAAAAMRKRRQPAATLASVTRSIP
jgi:hypothetical protein